MKSIRFRFFLWLITLTGCVLLVSNVLQFTQMEHHFRKEIEHSQELIAEGNIRGLEYYLSMIDQTGIAVVSDRLVGTTLSQDPGDTLAMLTARSEVNSQFYHLTSTVTGSDGYYYRSLLFLDERLPLTSSFSAADLNVDRGTINCVYANTLVKDAAWYQETLSRNRSLYIFLSEDKSSLCLAREILNIHYTGVEPNKGIGVMVTRLELSRLSDVFRFTQVTQGTKLFLLSPTGDVLFSNDPSLIGTHFDERNEVDPQHSIVYSAHVNWDMLLMFLTPISDVDEAMRPVTMIFLFTMLGVVVVVLAMGAFFSGTVTHPIVALSRTMQSITDTRMADTEALLHHKGQDEIAQIYQSFGMLIERTNSMIRELEARKEQQKRTEMKMMQAQINPHFLYNAMDSINWIALANHQDDIADMVGSLAALLRYSISSPDSPSTLRAELGNVQHYMALQKVRYGERVSIKVDVPEELLDTLLPPISLQPLVENAIRHGLGDDFSNVNICINGKKCNGLVQITVSDNGIGCDSKQLNDYLDGIEGKLTVHGGLGIRNVDERLSIFCQSVHALRYRNDPNGILTAVISIPAAGIEKKT
ncbi:MAG: sensor histidine kinase [Eubacteriales bacterium]|nr:sensor histidine kinase [Eubacteriales bacterium]